MTDLTVIRAYATACGAAVDRALEDFDAATARLVAAREEFDRLAALAEDPDVAPEDQPSRHELVAANDALVAARVDAAVAGQRANDAVNYAERMCLYAARCMGGDVSAESMRTSADAIRALVGPCVAIEPEVAA